MPKVWSLAICVFFLFVLNLSGCGGESEKEETNREDSSPFSEDPLEIEQDFSENIDPTDFSFDNFEAGDSFAWGMFIRPPFQSTEVEELPVPVFLAYFTPFEEGLIREGARIANEAVGFQVFEVVDEWSPQARPIYKVVEIFFDNSPVEIENADTVIGYTYSRNVYINNQYDAGRVVTDWAIELKEGYITPWVVAHELGHAMGIQKHALINYELDTLEELEQDSLMSAVISPEPVLNDYLYMMGRQGELLLDYLGIED